MNHSLRNLLRAAGGVLVLSLSSWAVIGSPAEASAQGRSASQDQKTFTSPEAAVQALLQAFKSGDEKALLDIFGHQHEDLIVVSDKVARREGLAKLSRAMAEAHKLQKAGDDQQVLVIGSEDWPFPIPIVKAKAGWRFDTDAGAEEILNRRIGQNELEAVEVCQAYFAAQLQYAGSDRDGDEVLEYAQQFMSTPGMKDGLYWEADPASGEALSPIGPFMADAAAYMEEFKKGQKIPYYGYYFKILTRQSADAPGGKYNYIINGNMIAGFALLACPADYGSSGVMSFIISNNGKIYEKDLGDKTLDLSKKMTEYDPDDTWTLFEED